MRPIRGRLLAVMVATGAVALAAPVSGANAQIPPVGLPLAPLGGPATAIGGNQIGTAGCVATNRGSFGGSAGSTSAQTCDAVLAFTGAQIGQIVGVIGPRIIGSPFTGVTVSAGPIEQVGP